MSYEDWVALGTMLLWGTFGFWTGRAYDRHDDVGFWFGLFLTFLWPIGIAINRVIKKRRHDRKS